jgi:hypothetical protein
VATNPIEVKTLDSFNLKNVDLIKIDVEGMELSVLRGSAKLIEECRPIIQLEANDVENTIRYIDFLRERNYLFFFMSAPAYNKNNFLKNNHNWFGVAHESAVIAINRDDKENIAIAEGIKDLLTRFSSYDEVAEMILGTPRHGDETIYDRKPRELLARISELNKQVKSMQSYEAELEKKSNFNAARAKVINDENIKLSRKLELFEGQRQITEKVLTLHDKLKDSNANLKREIESLKLEVERLSADRLMLDKTAGERQRMIDSILYSKSWKVTAPLRKVIGLFK